MISVDFVDFCFVEFVDFCFAYPCTISSTLWKELTEDGCPGVIDENELKRLDKNSDGVIDRAEFVSAVDELQGSHGLESEHDGGLFQPSQHGAFVFGEWLDLYKQYITQVLQFDPSGGMTGAFIVLIALDIPSAPALHYFSASKII